MNAPAVRHVKTAKVAELSTATWSNCLVIGDEIAMSGMTAHPASRENALGTYAQTLVVLGKIRDLVQAAGGGVGSIYKLVIYVTNIADKDEVGRARRDFFSAPYPCSTLVEVSALVFPELTVENRRLRALGRGFAASRGCLRFFGGGWATVRRLFASGAYPLSSRLARLRPNSKRARAF